MRLGKLALFSSVALALVVPAVAATRTRHSSAGHKAAASPHKVTAPSHKTGTSSHKQTAHAAKPKFQSQRGIDDQRATEIQEALIRAGYLSGSPSGHWDSASQAAMQKVQAENGWQTKLVPDSRALIKLGLGPGSGSPSAATSSSGTIASNSFGQGQQ